MRKVRGLSILMAMLLLFQLFGFNAGLMAEAEDEAVGDVQVSSVNQTEDMIEWRLDVSVTGSDEVDVVSEVLLSSGLTHGSLEAPDEVSVEQTEEGYRVTSDAGVYEMTLQTAIQDPSEQYSVEMLTTFNGQTVQDAGVVEVELADDGAEQEQEPDSSEAEASDSAEGEAEVDSGDEEQEETADEELDEQEEAAGEDAEEVDSTEDMKEEQEEIDLEKQKELVEQMQPTMEHPDFTTTAVPNALSGQSMGNQWPDPGSLRLNKSASETGTYAEWEVDLKVEGKNLRNSSDIVIVFDKSGSMAEGNRLSKAKDAANEFVDELLVEGSATRIALVEFSEYGLTTKDFTRFSGKEDLKNVINSIQAEGGTNIQAGIHQADELLENSTADQQTIVLLSDGAPTYSFEADDATAHSWPNGKYDFILSDFNYNWQLGDGMNYNYSFWDRYRPNGWFSRYQVRTNGIPTISEAHHIMNSGIDMYSIGLEVGYNNDANYVLENSQNKGYYNAGSDDLSPIFADIAANLIYPARDAVVTDPLGDMFNLSEDGSYSGENFNVSHGSVDWNDSSETFDWNIGNIQEGEEYTLTYKVQLDWTQDPKGQVNYPTNGETPLNYTDPNGDQSQKQFTIPEVSIDTGKIDVFGYRVNLDGDPIDANGDVVSKLEAELFYHDLFGEDLLFDTSHEVAADSVTDYTLLVGDDPTAMTLTAEEPFQSAWFGYVRSDEMVAGDVTVRHVDENGNELVEDEVLEGLIGETYTTSEKQIDGHTFKGLHEDSAPAAGEFSADAQTVTYVYGKQVGSLTVMKVDESGEPLEGAEFELSGPNGFSKTDTSDEDGLIVFDGLDWDTYTLNETKAPEGYRLLTIERTIEISVDSLHVNEEIENTSQDWEIPQTGGMGTIGFYGIGFVLMLLAFYLYRRNRKLSH